MITKLWKVQYTIHYLLKPRPVPSNTYTTCVAAASLGGAIDKVRTNLLCTEGHCIKDIEFLQCLKEYYDVVL